MERHGLGFWLIQNLKQNYLHKRSDVLPLKPKMLQIISNHAEEHDCKVSHKLVEFIQLKRCCHYILPFLLNYYADIIVTIKRGGGGGGVKIEAFSLVDPNVRELWEYAIWIMPVYYVIYVSIFFIHVSKFGKWPSWAQRARDDSGCEEEWLPPKSYCLTVQRFVLGIDSLWSCSHAPAIRGAHRQDV